jgi:MFS family permease
MARAEPALLRLPGFRPLALSVLLHATGMLGEQVALGWLTLELTDSPLWVGVALGLRMAPLLVAGLPAGALADRSDRVRLLRAANLAMAAATTVLGALVALGAAALWHVLVLTFATGCGRALQQVTQQSHAHDVVGAQRLVGALAALGLASRTGGLIGAFASGALLARGGSGVTYLAVAAAYLLSAAVLRRRGATASRAAGGAARTGVAGFLAVARQHPTLPLLIGLIAAAEILGFSHQTVLPSLARDVLAVGPEGLGAMNAARQAGGILGVAAVGPLGRAYGAGAVFLGVLVAFGLAVAALGAAPGYGAVLAALVVANAAGAIADVVSQGLVQRSVPSALRGRAGGAWVVAVGIAPLGHVQIGALAAWIGVGAGLAASGLGLVALVAAALLAAPRLRRL